MFVEIFRFETRFQFKRHLTYICALLFFLFGFGAVASDWVIVGGSIGAVNRNSPYVIMQILLVMTLLGMFVTTAFVAGTVQRDFELDVASTFFTAPITKSGYLGGRFLGALTVAMVPFVATAIGIMMGSAMPGVEAERVGPFTWSPYVFSFATIVIPNVVLTGAIFFSLATLSRSMLFTYVGVVAVFMGYSIASLFLADVENAVIAGMVDPFAFGAFEVVTQYWTVFEKNTQVLSLSGTFLWNRVLWVAVAGAIFGFTYVRFRFDLLAGGRRRRKIADDDGVATEAPIEFVPVRVSRQFTAATSLQQYAHEAWREFVAMVRSTPFIVILLLAILNTAPFALLMDQLYGTLVYPVSSLMVDAVAGGFILFIFIVITFFSGDLIWKERVLKLDEMRDALPTPTWVAWSSKLTALVGAIGALLFIATLTAMGIQVFSGFFDIELGVYGKGVFGDLGFASFLVAILAFGLHVATNNKYFGYLAMVLYYVALIVMPALDFEHNLYQYGARPAAPFSDMNQYGHFVAPMVWFYLYWGLVGVVMLALSQLFWQRGTDTGWRARRAVARQRLSRPVASTLGVGAMGVVASGAFIFYNTNILNRYETSNDETALSVEWEKRYKQYEGMLQPRITDVSANVDIFPESRMATIAGNYILRNKTDSVIDVLHVRLNRDIDDFEIGIPFAQLESSDTVFGYYIYRLGQPMAPGDSLYVAFETTIRPQGFPNSGSNTNLVYNGTFFNNFDYFPHFGYTRQFEITNPNERRKHGLPEAERMPPLSDDPADRRNTYLSTEADWVNFQTTVSTSPDQIAISPGYLQREWEENGRRYFRYEMDAPILNFYSYLSARYSVLRDRWNDVNIEIFYHDPHTYNLDRMVVSIKKSLEYFSANFSPYQHRQVRIIEFPRYATFAQAFPNTVPYSEGLGFIARIDDEEDIDYVFYVTAHEVAHQWWAHQVIGAFMQGATLMSETMAQYSALMVMEKEYGQEKMRRFLRYELDQYLRGRSGEQLEELPLMLVENQGYVHYRKGSLIMYALRDYIGEENLNAALARYVEDVAFQGPPYTNSREFVSYLRDVTPDSLQYVIEDMFETITLYDNRASDVTYEELDDGTYRVSVNVIATKYRADGKGVESEVAMNDWIDIGVFGEDDDGNETVLYLQKHRISDSGGPVEVTVDGLPVRGGIDPYNKLIDRNPGDNVTRASVATGN